MTNILTSLAALTAKDDELLPCPVCGSRAKIWTDARTIHRHWRAGCTGTSCVAIKARTRGDAITRWNARPSEQALIALVQEAAGEIERLRQALEEISKHQEYGGYGSGLGFTLGAKIARKALSGQDAVP